MARFFFHRTSLFVYWLEATAFVYSLFCLIDISHHHWFTTVILIPLFLSYIFMKYCAVRKWYPPRQYPSSPLESPIRGIEVHFKIIMVAVTYPFFFSVIAIYYHWSIIIPIIGLIALSVLVYINISLLQLHKNDKSPEWVNFMTHSHIE